MYKYPIAITQQFRFCGNPFRLDLYKGCDFGCKYCFSNSRKGGSCSDFDVADFKVIEKMFSKALESDKDTRNINIELIRKHVPLHVGGLSDPFQTREFNAKYRLTYRLIELSNKYNYPLIFSTKTSDLPDEYFKILNSELHAFQISLMGYDNSFLKKYENNTPSAQQRISFIKKLKSKNFWVGIRIQPLINVEQAIMLCKEIDGVVDYITIEHLKIPTDNVVVKEMFKDEVSSGDYKKPKNSRNLELSTDKKIKNIKKIKQYLHNIPVGCGDNDIHYLSDSRCCCGIDTIKSKYFKNWLKYNLTYFSTGKQKECIDNLYVPKNNISSIFTSDTRLNAKDFKTYVNYYCHCNNDLMCEECIYKDYFKKMDFENIVRTKNKNNNIKNI